MISFLRLIYYLQFKVNMTFEGKVKRKMAKASKYGSHTTRITRCGLGYFSYLDPGRRPDPKYLNLRKYFPSTNQDQRTFHTEPLCQTHKV
jgi:hypothetical protein